MRPLLSRSLLASLGTLLGLLVTEAGFRALEWGRPLVGEEVTLSWEPSSPFLAATDPMVGVTLAPGWTGQMVYRRLKDGSVKDEVSVRISSAGLRGPDQPVLPGTPRVLGLGDSFTFGQGVEEDQTWLSVAARTLDPQAQALHAAVPSWALQNEARWFQAHGAALQPTAVVLGYYVDDLFSGTVRPEEGGTGVRLPVPAWVRAEGGARSWCWSCNYVARRAEQRRWARINLASRGTWARRLRKEYDDRPAWHAAIGYLRSIHDVAVRAGAPACIVLFPMMEALPEDPLADLLERVEKEAVGVGFTPIRVAPLLRDLPLADRVIQHGDAHPSVEAHRRVGEAVGAWLGGL